MVIGVGSFALLFYQSVACWIFLTGAILFAAVQLMQTYESDSIAIKRLKRIQNLSDILFIVAGIILTDTVYGFFRDFFSNYENYVTYLYNKWVVVLFLATLLELYTVHRIDYELSKKNIKA